MPRKTIPKCRANNQWTEAKFWGWLRSGLRRQSTRWPPIYEARRKARRAYKGPNPRQKWEFACAQCGGWFGQKETQVDHVVECGSLRAFEDLPGFAQRLFVEADGLRVVCKRCHGKKTHAK